jgi:hypothetical protein
MTPPITPSAERPLRAVVVGSSVGYFVRPPGADRAEGPYPEQVVDALARHGVPAAVVNRARWFAQIDDAYMRIEDDVFSFSPDVVVLNFGWVECQPKLFPTAVLEWLTTYRPKLDPRTYRVRRAVVRRGSKVYKELTPWAASRTELPSRMSERHFEAELRRYVQTVRREQRSLVVVLNVNPPTDRIEAVLPGVTERARRCSALIERVVASFDDPQVRLLDSEAIVRAHGAEAILPDGIHFNVEGHRLVADQLAEVILGWLDR